MAVKGDGVWSPYAFCQDNWLSWEASKSKHQGRCATQLTYKLMVIA